MAYAFISYSSEDTEKMMALRAILQKNNIETFAAPDDIPAGSNFAVALTKALKGCGCLILLLTDSAQRSGWVAREVERAINYEKVIIPIMPRPLQLNEAFEIYVSTDQILQIQEFKESDPRMIHLLETVKAILQGEPAPAPAPSPLPAKKSGIKKWLIPLIAAIGALAIGGAVLISSLILPLIKGRQEQQPAPNLPAANQQQEGSLADDSKNPLQEEAQQQTPQASSPNQQAATKGENQIPSQFENQITALKYSSELALNTSTVRVKVGSYATPPAAAGWSNVTLYSQDTAIAIGEGPLVKGVAKGETYVVVAVSDKMGEAYRIIVE